MRTGISIEVTANDRERLLAIVGDRNTPQKHVWRCRIVLLTADGHGTAAIMCQADVAKTAVWRWQERVMQPGVDGLLRDKTRPLRIPPLGAEIIERVVRIPGHVGRWFRDEVGHPCGGGVLLGPWVGPVLLRRS